MYGGEPVDAATLMKWSQQSSTEELFQRVAKSSHAFEQMLALSARAQNNETPKGEIYTKLAAAGLRGRHARTRRPRGRGCESSLPLAGGARACDGSDQPDTGARDRVARRSRARVGRYGNE